DLLISSWFATEVELVELRVPGTAPCALTLMGVPSGWLLRQRCSMDAGVTIPMETGRAIEREKWQHFTLSVRLTPPKKVTLDIDNGRVVEGAALDAIGGTDTSVTFGVQHAVGSTVVFEDNLLVTSP